MALGGGKRKRELAAAIERGRTLRTEGGTVAAKFLEDAASRFPDSPEFPLLLATVYLELRPDEVSPQLEKAAELGSSDPAIQVRAGQMLLDGGDIEAARACALRAEQSVDGDFVTAAVEGLVGRIAAREGEYVIAEEKLRSALVREPQYDAHAIHLARFLWARGRNDDALAVIDESLAHASHKDDLEVLRGEIAAEN
jgi:tetratricopeptide (TPR) repeat protein